MLRRLIAMALAVLSVGAGAAACSKGPERTIGFEVVRYSPHANTPMPGYADRVRYMYRAGGPKEPMVDVKLGGQTLPWRKEVPVRGDVFHMSVEITLNMVGEPAGTLPKVECVFTVDGVVVHKQRSIWCYVNEEEIREKMQAG